VYWSLKGLAVNEWRLSVISFVLIALTFCHCCLAAHALRLAGALHIAHSLELRDAAPERIFYRQVELATQAVDQLYAETAQFHDQQETDSMLLMRHIHEQGFRADGCTWQWAKQQGSRAIRTMGSKMFAEAVQELVTFGYGVVKVEKPLTYRALKEMTELSR